MDLIDDLGNDLALAFLVERRYRQKLDSKDAIELIRRVKAALQRVSHREPSEPEEYFTESAGRNISH